MVEGEDTAAEALTNSERLQRHLKEGTLAWRLVQTYAGFGGSLDSLKGVMADRLDQVRRDLDQD
jgi:hypothetical protein